ncbi:restriction endonuclease subunit S [Tenacibaculum finnmarkense]|uniref:restriction endonuclease subunit S n=1 Tax=Tenacibaculum finnmarkense TaxID=2781243 RepID=UPI001E3BD036|nr:restriction endonuclease subunit S [Tenacibaculum finnmarkense]MCD8409650.1 restriction endonuclease subunit S [Tenacibaculum finnmarkense genomovar ulcerans]WCC43285.1 restriction endonuclease subunit S [Tenacibaculum finnmarkense]
MKNKLLKDLCFSDKCGVYGIPATAEDYDINKTRYLRITDISEDGKLLHCSKKSVTSDDIEKYILEEGDIVFARTGNSTGKSYFHESKNGRLAFAGFLIKFSINPELVNPKYLRYYTITNHYKQWVENFSLGSTRGNLNAQSFGECPIPLPNRNQQDFLAKVLSDLDAKIEVNNKINAALEAMAKTLYDYWFVQFDFPDKNGKPYKSSEGKMIFNEELKREIPVGWEVKELASKADFKNGKGMKKELLSDIGKTPVFGSNGIVGKTEKSLFNNTVIAIGRVGANYGEIHYSIDPCWITDNAVTSQPKSEIYLWWLLLTLKTINYSNISGGSAQPLITQGKLKALQFPIPNSFLLDEFHKIANPNYIKINNILKQNQKLSELRDWLLPMLMNGQVRVGE